MRRSLTDEEKDFNRRAGAAVRQIRVKQKITREEIGAALGGLHFTSVGKLETGETGMSLYQAAKIADLLGVSLNDLVRIADGEEQPSQGKTWAPRSFDKESGLSIETPQPLDYMEYMRKNRIAHYAGGFSGLSPQDLDYIRWMIDDSIRRSREEEKKA